MSTLAEIEAAIEELPASQIEELAIWLKNLPLDGSSASPDSTGGQKPPVRSIREFFGMFASGDPHGANNERIDADLAREAAGNS